MGFFDFVKGVGTKSGEPGKANSGGGGAGGLSLPPVTGGTGGSGIVIVRWFEAV